MTSSTKGPRLIAAASERSPEPARSLDPADWPSFRELAHRVLDDALDHVQGARERPVWTPMPPEVVERLVEPLPADGRPVAQISADLADLILPYGVGNTHPRFFGWVHGSGTASGLLPEMMAAAMNANVGGRDHGAVHVERQVISWCHQLFGFPDGASGLLVSGTSMATLIALTVARNAAAGVDVRAEGVAGIADRLVAYTSAEAHSSVKRAFEILGLGSTALRSVPVDAGFRVEIDRLREAIERDRQEGLKPFCVVATAGTVNTGAIDDIDTIAGLCAKQGLWLHVDGAFGALAIMSDRLKPRLAGIERADSLAFDFHKWMHVPYDAGCVLVRRGDLHHAAFAMHAPYLAPQQRGLAGGEPWFCDFGPELSRGFRALKVWFALREHGTRRLGQAIEENCLLAQQLAERVSVHSDLALLAPVALNIVCFRFAHAGLSPADLDRLNVDIVADLQESGLAAPSTTRLGGRTAIRVNITNHRTTSADLGVLIDAITAIGRRRVAAGATIDGAGQSDGPMPAQIQRALAQVCGQQEVRHEQAGRGAPTVLADVAVPTEQLLVAGGGSRLRIDPKTGCNAYGSAPRPRPEALALASSTASTISPLAYKAAEATRVVLVGAALSGRLDESIALEFEQVRRRLLLACGFDPCEGVEAVLTPSGTDGEFAALHLARGGADVPLVNIVVAPDETGSGVPYSALGRHFSPRTPQGAEVACGASLAGMHRAAITLNTVEIRDRHGLPRPAAEIDAKIERLVADAVGSGAHCLVHVLDCSKTGLQAPSFDFVRRLRERHGTRVNVAVDACQMRLGKAQLRAYLAAGFMVQITGSKFYMGPPFAGALLVPREIAARAADMAPLPASLGAYFSRLEWPAAWSRLTAGLSADANLGLLLRWQAALAEMEAFNRLPERLRIETMTALAEALRTGIAASDTLVLVAAQPTAPDWPPTIFAVQVLRRDAQGIARALDMVALKEMHALLNQDLSARLPAAAGVAERDIAAVPCHIGQPVKIGADGAALRICIGSRQIVEVAAPSALGATPAERLGCQIARFRLALSKIELVAAGLAGRADESIEIRRHRVG